MGIEISLKRSRKFNSDHCLALANLAGAFSLMLQSNSETPLGWLVLDTALTVCWLGLTVCVLWMSWKERKQRKSDVAELESGKTKLEEILAMSHQLGRIEAIEQQGFYARRAKDLDRNQTIVCYGDKHQPYETTVKSVSHYHKDFCIVRVNQTEHMQAQSVACHTDQLIEVLP